MWLILFFAAWTQAAPQPPAASSSALDFDTFKTKIEPLFLEKRPGHARCVVCHSTGTAFRLQPLVRGQGTWTDEQSRKNFEMVTRFVLPGVPSKSRLLVMPLAHEAGGTSSIREASTGNRRTIPNGRRSPTGSTRPSRRRSTCRPIPFATTCAFATRSATHRRSCSTPAIANTSTSPSTSCCARPGIFSVLRGESRFSARQTDDRVEGAGAVRPGAGAFDDARAPRQHLFYDSHRLPHRRRGTRHRRHRNRLRAGGRPDAHETAVAE
jgi:hypothetical protein